MSDNASTHQEPADVASVSKGADAPDVDVFGMSDDDFLSMSEPPSGDTPLTPPPSEDESGEETETSENQTEKTPADEAIEENKAEKADKAENESDHEDAPKEKSEDVTDISNDAQAQLDKLFSPFKANGKEIKIDTVEEALKLMQMGANYNMKMRGMKPHLKMLKTLENNNLLDENKINFLIDLDKKNPKAINKLLQDAKFDPYEADYKQEGSTEYSPQNYSISDSEMELDAVLDSISHTESYGRTLDVIGSQWDDQSKSVLVNQPSMIPLLNDHVASGLFDQISQRMDKERLLGTTQGMSDIQAYKFVGDMIALEGGFNNQQDRQMDKQAVLKEKAAQAKLDQEAQANSQKRNEQKRRASATKSSPPKAPEAEFNPLAMSDEDFAKYAAQMRF